MYKRTRSMISEMPALASSCDTSAVTSSATYDAILSASALAFVCEAQQICEQPTSCSTH